MTRKHHWETAKLLHLIPVTPREQIDHDDVKVIPRNQSVFQKILQLFRWCKSPYVCDAFTDRFVQTIVFTTQSFKLPNAPINRDNGSQCDHIQRHKESNLDIHSLILFSREAHHLLLGLNLGVAR